MFQKSLLIFILAKGVRFIYYLFCLPFFLLHLNSLQSTAPGQEKQDVNLILELVEIFKGKPFMLDVQITTHPHTEEIITKLNISSHT